MIREIEQALAAEAAGHAVAAAELNPFGEAESLELGDARAVYSGAWSPVHGVFGLGLDGPVEERDIREINKFYFKKERPPAYWVTPATDPSLLEILGRDFAPAKTLPVHGAAPAALAGLPEPAGSSRPDHGEWTLAFTRVLDPLAREPGLFALTKIHQRDIRFYLGPAAASASYTFFGRALALVPYPGTHSLLALQLREAIEFKAAFFATAAASPLPLLYERTLYERL